MLRILRFFITGDWHLHQWETVQSCVLSCDTGERGTRWILRCKHCGNVKKKDCI